MHYMVKERYLVIIQVRLFQMIRKKRRQRITKGAGVALDVRVGTNVGAHAEVKLDVRMKVLNCERLRIS